MLLWIKNLVSGGFILKNLTKNQTQEIIKEEMNLTEIPFCYPSKRLPNNFKEIIYEKIDIDNNKNQVKRKMTVRYPTTEIGERVYLGLMAISRDEGFPQQIDNFSIYKLLNILNMNNDGRSYREIKRALRELHEVSIYTEEAFWDNKKKKYISTDEQGFHVIDKWKIKKQGENESGYIKWSDTIYQSIVRNEYIKNLNLKFYLSLDDSLARRLYRYLDKRMYNSLVFETEVSDIVCIIGLVNYKYMSDLRKRLDPALEELKKKGFLKDYTYTNKSKSLKICKMPKLLIKEVKENSSNDFISNIANEFKIRNEIIEQLISKHGKDLINKAYKYAKENADKNPAGLFLCSLKENYIIEDCCNENIDNIKKLKMEADKCYKGCSGHCAASFQESERMKEKKSCYWCLKFASERDALKQSKIYNISRN